jgi:RES domain
METLRINIDLSSYLADFRHEFHDIRGDPDFLNCLDPNSYTTSQILGLELLTSGSAGIVYPSVRHKDGDCIACFRPPLGARCAGGAHGNVYFIDAEMTAVVIEN